MKPLSKTFFSFKSFTDSDFLNGGILQQFSEDNDLPMDITKIDSKLVRFLLLLKDTISFH